MKRFKRRLSQTLRGSHTIDESLSELAEQMTIEENGLKDNGTFILSVDDFTFHSTHDRCNGREITTTGSGHAGLNIVSFWIITICIIHPPQTEVYCLEDVELEGKWHSVLSQLIFTDSAGSASRCLPRWATAWLPWCPGSGNFQEFPWHYHSNLNSRLKAAMHLEAFSFLFYKNLPVAPLWTLKSSSVFLCCSLPLLQSVRSSKAAPASPLPSEN